MIKYVSSCAVCKAIKGNKKLIDELYGTRFYLKTSGISLSEFHRRYSDKFSYPSLTNHVKKHQFISEVAFTNRHLAQASQKAERTLIRQAIESREVFDEVIGQGMEKLQSGEMEINTDQLLKAAALKKNFQLKEQDQQLAMMEMIYHFASGENNRSQAYDRRIAEGKEVEDYDPSIDLAEDSDRRTEQSRTFYQSLAGDAVASGTD